MTQSPRRPRLVPKAAIIAGVVIVVLLTAAAVSAYLVAQSRLVTVPDMAGMTETTARSVLTESGLTFAKLGTRVSLEVPVGGVISQDPKAGTKVRRGSEVGVFLSAGQQSFVVPDLIGSPLSGAEEVLTALGFTVVIESGSSNTTEPIVLEMYPAPGTSVSVGDEIRLTVPGNVAADDALLPYDLQGLTILLDPLPVAITESSDVPMEVSRRLRALLEAAGATVATTRSSAGALSTPEERTALASASTAELLISIDLGASGKPGVTVLYLPASAGQQRSAKSLEYAQAITRAATLPDLTVNEPRVSSDSVLVAFPHTAVSVLVGDMGAEADRMRFADPTWADQVARAIYRGVGTTFAEQ